MKSSLACGIFIVMCLLSRPNYLLAESDGHARNVGNQTHKFFLGSAPAGKLYVDVRRQVAAEFPAEEQIVCEFYNVINKPHKNVDQKISDPGFEDQDIVETGDFLHNGRQQILVATVENNTNAKIYDFDGKTVKTVYSTDSYDGRMFIHIRWLSSGQPVIQELFSANGGREKPQGSIYVKDRKIFVRVVRWQNGKWEPIKFKYISESNIVKFDEP